MIVVHTEKHQYDYPGAGSAAVGANGWLNVLAADGNTVVASFNAASVTHWEVTEEPKAKGSK